MSRYSLPDLPYDYGALEPHYAAEALQLHHGKHHAAYVAGANTSLERLAEARAAHGQPAERLIAMARHGGYEVIVAGSRGHGLKNVVLGSVAGGLASGAPVPVLIGSGP